MNPNWNSSKHAKQMSCQISGKRFHVYQHYSFKCVHPAPYIDRSLTLLLMWMLYIVLCSITVQIEPNQSRTDTPNTPHHKSFFKWSWLLHHALPYTLNNCTKLPMLIGKAYIRDSIDISATKIIHLRVEPWTSCVLLLCLLYWVNLGLLGRLRVRSYVVMFC